MVIEQVDLASYRVNTLVAVRIFIRHLAARRIQVMIRKHSRRVHEAACAITRAVRRQILRKRQQRAGVRRRRSLRYGPNGSQRAVGPSVSTVSLSAMTVSARRRSCGGPWWNSERNIVTRSTWGGSRIDQGEMYSGQRSASLGHLFQPVGPPVGHKATARGVERAAHCKPGRQAVPILDSGDTGEAGLVVEKARQGACGGTDAAAARIARNEEAHADVAKKSLLDGESGTGRQEKQRLANENHADTQVAPCLDHLSILHRSSRGVRPQAKTHGCSLLALARDDADKELELNNVRDQWCMNV